MAPPHSFLILDREDNEAFKSWDVVLDLTAAEEEALLAKGWNSESARSGRGEESSEGRIQKKEKLNMRTTWRILRQ